MGGVRFVLKGLHDTFEHLLTFTLVTVVPAGTSIADGANLLSRIATSLTPETGSPGSSCARTISVPAPAKMTTTAKVTNSIWTRREPGNDRDVGAGVCIKTLLSLPGSQWPSALCESHHWWVVPPANWVSRRVCSVAFCAFVGSDARELSSDCCRIEGTISAAATVATEMPLSKKNPVV
jgi:hypothetical protein